MLKPSKSTAHRKSPAPAPEITNSPPSFSLEGSATQPGKPEIELSHRSVSSVFRRIRLRLNPESPKSSSNSSGSAEGLNRRSWSPLCYVTQLGLVFVCLGVLVEIEFRDRGRGNEKLREREGNEAGCWVCGGGGGYRRREATGEGSCGREREGRQWNFSVPRTWNNPFQGGGGTQKHPISAPWNSAFHLFLAYQTRDVPSRPTCQTHPTEQPLKTALDEEKSSSNYFIPPKKHKAAMDGSRVDWTNLPHQLPPLIADRLQTHLEHLRFRSVCSSWRSSIPRFQSSNPPRFPTPLSQGPTAFLSQTTVYLVRSDPDPNANRSASSSSTSSFKGWLLKLEESSGKIRLLNPITSSRIGYLNDGVAVNPMDLNLLDFNMVELTRACVLRYTNGSGSIFGINKVVISPNFKDYCSVFMIYNEGKLGFAKIGDQKLTLINDQVSDYDDMIVYKGRPYVVDKWGQVFCIDSSSLELVPFSPPIGFGHRKNLVECCGELCVVDRYLDHRGSNSREGGFGSVYYNFFQRYPLLRRRFYEAGQLKVVDFRVYKLLEDGDEELGRRWVEVKSLEEQALFLTVDCCFSVLAAELEGCKGNCIYFTNSNDIGLAFRELVRPDGSVFSMEDHSIESLGSSPLYSKMFWSLPT